MCFNFRRKSKRKFGNPMCFCVYVLQKLDKIQFTVTDDDKEYVEMLGMNIKELN